MPYLAMSRCQGKKIALSFMCKELSILCYFNCVRFYLGLLVLKIQFTNKHFLHLSYTTL